MLLSDSRVKEFLTNEVVPSWEKVRDVPRVTIDFGGGKVLKRTLKGNTVMYLCTPDGRVIDAFPGVYTPEDFLPLARQSVRTLTTQSFSGVLAWHTGQARLRASKRLSIDGEDIQPLASGISKGGAESAIVPEKRPQPTAAGKGSVQSALAAKSAVRKLPNPFTGEFEAAAARLEDVSSLPMSPGQAIRVATGVAPGSLTPKELGELAVRRDSQINVSVVRPVIHLWFASLAALPTPAGAKDAMFEKILHVPYKDPYLGLADIELPGTPNGGR